MPVVDYVVTGEGEHTVKDLLLKREKSEIPNLYYLKDGKYAASGRLNDCMPVREYAPPLYERDNILPVLRASNNNCYWNRCAFCTNYNNSNTPQTQLRRAGQVVQDLLEIKSDVDESLYFCFSDSSFSKHMLADLIAEMEKTPELSCNCRIFLRLEPWLTEDLLLRARQVGFGRGQGRLVFGLETASPRLLKLMNKGIRMDTANRIFEICARYNINIQINFIVNWPTQTREELLNDLEYGYKIIKKFNKTNHAIIKINLFSLREGTDIHLNPEKYKLKILHPEANSLRMRIPFEKTDKGGIRHPDEALQITHDFLASIPSKYHRCYFGQRMREIKCQLGYVPSFWGNAMINSRGANVSPSQGQLQGGQTFTHKGTR